MVKANLYSCVFAIPVILLYGVVFVLIWGINFRNFEGNQLLPNVIFWVFGFILGIVLHELIHGIVFAKYAKKGFKSVKFGILWKMLTPYCYCKEPLQVKYYRLALVMPTIVLGFIPFLVSLFFGSFSVLIFAGIITISAIGDFMVIYLLRKENQPIG